MEPRGQLPPQDWISHPSTVNVIKALEAGGKPARFVGGCVRDALLNKPISDIDIATPEAPERVKYLLEEVGIKVVPFGLSHGTVLAVTAEMSFHVTTLRTDVETFGRKARVSYIDDWAEDAKRRDFTMNALYVDLDRTLYDPCDGLKDVKAGRVRFIGEPAQRIQEDYLRILRFFRFQAFYGKVPPETAHLEACHAAASHLKILSGERIWYELRRLLASDNPLTVLGYMLGYNILPYIFSFRVKEETISRCFANLVGLERQYSAPISSLRRLACLIDGSVPSAQHIRQDLPLSNDELQHLVKVTKLINDKPDLNKSYQVYRVLYTYGADLYYDYILLRAARENQVNINKYVDVLSSWTSPSLPIQGKDILELGIQSGPQIGKLLARLTDWWLENSCRPNRDQCIEWILRNKP